MMMSMKGLFRDGNTAPAAKEKLLLPKWIAKSADLRESADADVLNIFCEVGSTALEIGIVMW